VSPASQPIRPAARAASSTTTYELWRDAEGNYAFFPRDNAQARAGVGETSELVWSVEAASWDEAMAARRQYLGWG
jgi:hypothetical protein